MILFIWKSSWWGVMKKGGLKVFFIQTTHNANCHYVCLLTEGQCRRCWNILCIVNLLQCTVSTESQRYWYEGCTGVWIGWCTIINVWWDWCDASHQITLKTKVKLTYRRPVLPHLTVLYGWAMWVIHWPSHDQLKLVLCNGEVNFFWGRSGVNRDSCCCWLAFLPALEVQVLSFVLLS